MTRAQLRPGRSTMTSGSSARPDKIEVFGVDDDGNLRRAEYSPTLKQVRRVGTGETAVEPERVVERTHPMDVKPGDRITGPRGDAVVLRVLTGEGNTGQSTLLLVMEPDDNRASEWQYQNRQYVDVTGHGFDVDQPEAAVLDAAIARYNADRSNVYLSEAIRDVRAGGVPESAPESPSAPSPSEASEAAEGPTTTDGERLTVPGTDIQLTPRSSEWFRTLVGEMQMWDGAGLITSDMAGLGNITDLKLKGLVVTEESEGGRGRVAFAKLTKLGVELAESLNLDVPEYAVQGKVRPVKETTPEEYAARSHPPIKTAGWLGAFDERAKVASRKRYIPILGDDQLWVAKWKIEQKQRNPYNTEKDTKRLGEILAELESQIRYRGLVDPSLRPLPDGRQIDPADHKQLIDSSRGEGVPTGKALVDLARRSRVTLPSPETAPESADVPATPAAPEPAFEAYDFEGAAKRQRQRVATAAKQLRADGFGTDANLGADVLGGSRSDVIDRYVAGDRMLSGDNYRELAHEFEAAGDLAGDPDAYEGLALRMFSLAADADEKARRAAETPTAEALGFGPRTTPVRGDELRVGDKLDDRTRVSKVLIRDGSVTVQTKVQGSTSPSVRRFAAGEYVPVYGRGADPADPTDMGDVNERGSKAYKAAYARGYKSSQRFGGLGSSSLENADGRGEPEAWYDGYHDHAADRPKWTSMKLDPKQLERYNRGEIDADGNEIDQDAAQLERMGFRIVPPGDDPVVDARIRDLYDAMSGVGQPDWFPGEEFHPASLAESSLANALEAAVDEGFATQAPNPRGESWGTVYAPVPPITDGGLERWVDEQASVGFLGMLDSYGFQYHDGVMRVRPDLESQRPGADNGDPEPSALDDPFAAADRIQNLGLKNWTAEVGDQGVILVRTAAAEGNPDQRYQTRLSADGVWEYERDGKWSAVSGMRLRGVADALRGGDAPSYTDRLAALRDDPSLVSGYGAGSFDSWPTGVVSDFVADYKLPARPYVRSDATVKERDSHWRAITAWKSDIRDVVESGRPFGEINTQASPDDPTDVIEAELDRLGRLARAAAADDEATTDKAGRGRLLDSLDHYKSDRSRRRVRRIASAATPLREEAARRLAAEVGSGVDPNYDAERWDDVTGVRASIAGYGGESPESRKTRDTYVVQDANTVEKNASLRSGSPTPAAKAWRSRINKWVSTSTASSDSRVYRGSALSPQFVRQMKIGATVTDAGVMSTASEPGLAETYLDLRVKSRPDAVPVMFEILVPAGHSIVDAQYDEFVLGAGQSMTVRKVVYVDGTYRITLELG